MYDQTPNLERGRGVVTGSNDDIVKFGTDFQLSIFIVIKAPSLTVFGPLTIVTDWHYRQTALMWQRRPWVIYASPHFASVVNRSRQLHIRQIVGLWTSCIYVAYVYVYTSSHICLSHIHVIYVNKYDDIIYYHMSNMHVCIMYDEYTRTDRCPYMTLQYILRPHI